MIVTGYVTQHSRWAESWTDTNSIKRHTTLTYFHWQYSTEMTSTQKPRRRRATRPSNHHQLHTMLHEPGSHDIERHKGLLGVQSIHCDPVSDRPIKYALWHEGDPFVLERRTKRIKKCRGCRKKFVDEKFIVRHEEKVYFVKNNIRRQTIAKVSYHCRPRCIRRRHSDFDTYDLIIEPIVLNNLTTNDLKLFADDGFDVTFLF